VHDNAPEVSTRIAIAVGASARHHRTFRIDVALHKYAFEVSDDDCVGIVVWTTACRCVGHGDGTCGPDTMQSVCRPGGDEGGLLVDPWPVA
jgi:hypothetical protein